MENGEYRLLELNMEKREARISSATQEEIKASNPPRWTYQRRSRFDTPAVDQKLRRRAQIRGYKVLSR